MIKELKYVFYIIVILFFSFVTVKFYFSDQNKKKSYRSLNLFDSKINNFDNLILLKENTNNIIEYTNNLLNKKKTKRKFLELLKEDEKQKIFYYWFKIYFFK